MLIYGFLYYMSSMFGYTAKMGDTRTTLRSKLSLVKSSKLLPKSEKGVRE
jgi:hypothetical protein